MKCEQKLQNSKLIYGYIKGSKKILKKVFDNVEKRRIVGSVRCTSH